MSRTTLDYWAGVIQERMGPVQNISNDKYFNRGMDRIKSESEGLLIHHHLLPLLSLISLDVNVQAGATVERRQLHSHFFSSFASSTFAMGSVP